MKNKIIILVVSLLMVLSMVGCTAQERAKNWGGTTEVNLDPNKKLVEITWKDDDLWYLTKVMKDSDIAEDYEFSQSSSWGFFSGKVIIHEIKLNEEELMDYYKQRTIDYNGSYYKEDYYIYFEDYYKNHFTEFPNYNDYYLQKHGEYINKEYDNFDSYNEENYDSYDDSYN